MSNDNMATAVEQNTTQINGLNRKADMQMMHCSVCNIFLNSISQADAHFAGKSHKNKAKSSSLEGGTPTDTPTQTQVTENSQFYKCDVCQKFFNSSLQLQDHMHGKAHQQMAQKKLENNPGISNTETLSPGTLNPGTMNPGTMNPGTMNPGTLTPKIETSDDTTKSETTVIQHTTNEPSQPVNQVTNMGKNLSDLFHCERCNITLNSKKQMEQHNKGLRHKIIIGKAKPPAVSGEKWENVRYVKISNAILGINKDTATGSGGGMNLREYHCEKCNITVNSQTQLDQHLESNKHKMNGVQPPDNGQNKRKRPTTGHGGGQNLQWNNKRPCQGPRPLANNFINSDTFIPAGRGKPVYRLPPLPYPPQNTGLQNWTNNSFSYMDTNIAMF